MTDAREYLTSIRKAEERLSLKKGKSKTYEIA